MKDNVTSITIEVLEYFKLISKSLVYISYDYVNYLLESIICQQDEQEHTQIRWCLKINLKNKCTNIDFQPFVVRLKANLRWHLMKFHIIFHTGISRIHTSNFTSMYKNLSMF